MPCDTSAVTVACDLLVFVCVCVSGGGGGGEAVPGTEALLSRSLSAR